MKKNNTFSFLSESVKTTLSVGRILGEHSHDGDIVLLSGNLGSGKTVFAKGIAQGLGISEEAVLSPTFVILRQYKGKRPLYHFDLYRLENEREISDLGYEEYFYSDGVSVVEWPEKLKKLSPKEYLKVEFKNVDIHSRKMLISAVGDRYKKILENINENLSR